MFLNRFSQNLQTPIYKRFTAINNVLPAVSPVSFLQPYWKISHSHVATDDSEKSLTFHSPIPDIDKFWTQWFQVESLKTQLKMWLTVHKHLRNMEPALPERAPAL